MERILEILALNALGAAVLAIPVLAAGRWIRNPAIVHILWVVVLAKLVVPPVVELRLLPAPAPRETPAAVALPDARPAMAPLLPAETAPDEPRDTATPVLLSPSKPGIRIAPILVAAEGTGLVLVLLLAAIRVVRFRRLVRSAPPASRSVRDRAARVAAAMGLRRAPRIRLPAASVPPALWPGPPCEILLPRALWSRLTGEQRDALLAHELAHVRRRDHWVRPLELVAMAAFWWHPVAWWARRSLRAAEEAAADTLVLRATGNRSRAYAETLLETLEFLAGSRAGAVPALATGAGDFARIKERLTMIIRNRAPRPLSPLARTALGTIALAALVAGPTWTAGALQDSPEPPPAAPEVTPPPPAPEEPPAPPAPEAVAEPAQEEIIALRREQLRLEQQVAELQMQRDELEHEAADIAWGAEIEQLRKDAARLEREGQATEAAEVREKMEYMQQQRAVQAAQLRAQLEQRSAELKLQFRLQELELRHEELSSRSRHEEAKAAYEEAERLQRELERTHLKAVREQLERELKALEEQEKQSAGEEN